VDRQCARPTCSAPAVAAFNFDGLKRIVWLNAIADAPSATAGDLCDKHAERFRPPMHWELHDLRSGTLDVTVGEPPPQRPVKLDAKAAKQRRDRALLPDGDESSPEADESTPLLARAFRAAG
jgi:hypothetical protein